MEETILIRTYRESVHPLFEYVSRRCGGDRSLAEDVVQETWLRAVVAWEKSGFPETPLAWLKTVVAGIAMVVGFWRHRKSEGWGNALCFLGVFVTAYGLIALWMVNI